MWQATQSIPWSVLYVLDLCAIAVFVFSYYFTCYRKGYRIDFWHAQVFLACVMSNMLLLPFSKSEMNVFVLGRDLSPVVAVLPTIFIITLVGYIALLAGGSLWRLQLGLGLRTTTARVLEVVPRCSMMVMSSRSVLVFQSVLCLFLQLLILALYFSHSGFGFNLRGYTFENPTLRPVALIISNYSVIIASHCLARYVDSKERILLFSTLLLSFGLLFFGARGNLLAIYLNVLLCYMVGRRDRISLRRIGSLVVVMIVVGFYLGNVRAGDYSVGDFLGSIVFLLLYGNNFSDLRDFAWVYAGWDHVLWGGKTYLAALLAFVPRFASQFRDTWGIGVATDLTAGLDPQVHPGLRPGIFGEGFFNFGVLGVIAVGLILGIILRRVDSDVKRAVTSSPPSMRQAFASTTLLSIGGCFAISNSSSGVYVLGVVYLISWICLCVQRTFQPPLLLAGSEASSSLKGL